MNVFLSWSGPRSKQMALFLEEWLPSVIQAVEPFVSPRIDKGARWALEIGKTLEECNYGIFCLTRTNLEAPWLMFEAGALTKSVTEGRAATILIDSGMNPAEVKGPLAQFQHTSVEKEQINQLIQSVNKHIGSPLNEKTLEKAFERAWPEFVENYQEILKIEEEGTVTKRSDSEMLEEVINICRSLENQLSELRTANPLLYLMRKRALNEVLGEGGKEEGAPLLRKDWEEYKKKYVSLSEQET